MNINKHEMSDDELDRLFSESAEKMKFDFDPDSWAKMSQKLDAAAPPPSSSQGMTPWLKWSLLLLIGLLAFVGGYFMLKSSASQSKETMVNLTKKAESEQTRINSKKYVETSKVDTDNIETEENATEVTQNSESNKVNNTTKESEVLSESNENFGIKKSTEANKFIEKGKVALSNKTIEKSLKSDKNNNFSEKNTKIYHNSEDKILVKNANKRRINANLSESSTEANSNNSLVEIKEFSTRNTSSKSKKKIIILRLSAMLTLILMLRVWIIILK